MCALFGQDRGEQGGFWGKSQMLAGMDEKMGKM